MNTPSCTPIHQYTYTHTPTHLIVDSVRCVHVRCPLQYTRLASLTDLLQGCKVVNKSSTAVFTGGGRARTLLIRAQWANCTDRQTDRQEMIQKKTYATRQITALVPEKHNHTHFYTQRDFAACIASPSASTSSPLVTCYFPFCCEPCIHSLHGSLHTGGFRQ